MSRKDLQQGEGFQMLKEVIALSVEPRFLCYNDNMHKYPFISRKKNQLKKKIDKCILHEITKHQMRRGNLVVILKRSQLPLMRENYVN